jgi:hypothetical protein
VAAVAVDAAAMTLALVGVLVLLEGSRWGQAALGLALVGVAVKLTAGWHRPASRRSGLGRSPVLRAAVVAGTAVAFVAGSASETSAVLAGGTAAVLLVAALVAEPFVARAAAFRVPVAAHLPGVQPVPTYPDLRPHAVLASLAATALGLVLAAAGMPAWWWLLGSVLAVVPLTVLALAGVAKILRSRRRRSQVPQAVAAHAPDIVLYTGRPDDASYQLTMWLPYLRRTGQRFLIITRNAVPAAALAELTDIPVVEVRAAGDLERFVVPSLKAALYVNASSANGAFVRFQHLTHIYIGHGDSEKPPSYNPTHALYDQIYVAGPAATRRYAAHGVTIAPEKFRVVGRPQVEDVEPVERSIAEVADPVVLYAPTWRGHVEESMLSSLPEADRIVQALLDRGATVIFRPHPFSYDFADDTAVIRRVQALLEDDRRRSGRAHLWGAAAERDRSILDCVNASDALVSDVSSVVSDYLQSGKPFAMVSVPTEPERFVAEYPVAAASYVVRGDLANLEPQLDRMLGPDPLRGQRRALRTDYLGDFPSEGYADAFVHAVQQVDRKPLPDLGDEDADTEGESPTGEATTGEEDDRPLPASEEATDEEDPAQPAGAPAARSGAAGRNLAGHQGAVLRVGLGLGGTGLALLALVAALLDAAPWVAALLAVLSLVAALLPLRSDVRRRSRQYRLLTEGDVTRAVLLVGLAVLADEVGKLTWPVWLGVVVLGVALVGERRIQAAWGQVGLTAVNLPGALRPVRQVVPRGWLTLAGFAVLGASFLLLTGSDTDGFVPDRVVPVWFGVVAVLVAVLFLTVLERSVRRALAVEAGERRLRPALAGHAPEFVLYLSSDPRAEDQVGRWLPDLGQVARPFLVVTRSVEMLRHVARLSDRQGLAVPVVHRPSLRSLDDVMTPSLTAAFYVTNGVRNTHFVERRELTHVWLNGGESDEPTAYSPVHAIYDLIFVPDPETLDGYARHGVHIPQEKFVLAGADTAGFVNAARGVVDARSATIGAAVPGERQP